MAASGISPFTPQTPATPKQTTSFESPVNGRALAILQRVFGGRPSIPPRLTPNRVQLLQQIDDQKEPEESSPIHPLSALISEQNGDETLAPRNLNFDLARAGDENLAPELGQNIAPLPMNYDHLGLPRRAGLIEYNDIQWVWTEDGHLRPHLMSPAEYAGLVFDLHNSVRELREAQGLGLNPIDENEVAGITDFVLLSLADVVVNRRNQ